MAHNKLTALLNFKVGYAVFGSLQASIDDTVALFPGKHSHTLLFYHLGIGSTRLKIFAKNVETEVYAKF